MRLQEHIEPLRLDLATGEHAERIRIDFLTPTELKAGGQVVEAPRFIALFARVRDRINSLRTFYGESPLPIDFKSIAERAGAIRMTRCELRRVFPERKSGRTAQRHRLGGFVGVAEYEGDLTEFLPFLRAAEWTGVGRQTIWGKGSIRVV